MFLKKIFGLHGIIGHANFNVISFLGTLSIVEVTWSYISLKPAFKKAEDTTIGITEKELHKQCYPVQKGAPNIFD